MRPWIPCQYNTLGISLYSYVNHLELSDLHLLHDLARHLMRIGLTPFAGKSGDCAQTQRAQR